MSCNMDKYINCDVCGIAFGQYGIVGGNTFKNIRKAAKNNGWIYKNKGDYCPKCVANLPKKGARS